MGLEVSYPLKQHYQKSQTRLPTKDKNLKNLLTLCELSKDLTMSAMKSFLTKLKIMELTIIARSYSLHSLTTY